MSRAIAAHNNDGADKTDSPSAYGKLRSAAKKSYSSLVTYGATMDLSSRMERDGAVYLEEGRRSRLLQFGRNIWMDIRNNPELFNDITMPSEDKLDSDGDSSEGRNDKAIASGYVRAIAARLVFLNYVDSRCKVGVPPKLRNSFNVHGETAESPSLQELEFGLKLFSRAGRVIVEHNRHDARASYDLISLAASCFESISTMADNGSGEAAIRMKDLLDEAFDVISMLPTAASLFGETCIEQAAVLGDTTWQALVINSLARAESFVDRHCNVSTTSSLQSSLPSLAKLCYKVNATICFVLI